MTEHIDNRKIVVATTTGSVIAAALTALTFAIGNTIIYGMDGVIVLIFIVGLVVGIPVALLFGVPVGFVLAWSVGLAGSMSPRRAVAAGGLTALSLASAAAAFGFFRNGSPTDYLLLLSGATVIGGMSGWGAYRVHFQPRSES